MKIPAPLSFFCRLVQKPDIINNC